MVWGPQFGSMVAQVPSLMECSHIFCKGIDTLPVFPLLHHPNVTEVYAVVYGSALTSGGAQLPSYLSDILLLVNAIATINDMRVDLFAGGICCILEGLIFLSAFDIA